MKYNVYVDMSIINEVGSQIKISLPTTVGLLLYKLPWMISLHFVGQLGPDELSAAALATTICNITGMSICLGMSSAVSTLTGQTTGRIQQDLSKNGLIQRDGVNYNLNSSLITEGDPAKNDGKWKINAMESATSVKKTDTTFKSIEQHDAEGLSPIMTLLFRGIILPYAIIVPVGIWWISGIKATLIMLGQAEQVSIMAEVRRRILSHGSVS